MIDTNVLIAGLRRRGPAGAVVDAWVERRRRPCVSTALALEYEEVMARKLGARRREAAPGRSGSSRRRGSVPVRFTYRPASPDPGDDLVVDCVVNSGAVLVTDNQIDFRKPSRELGFRMLTPAEFLALLNETSS